MRSILTRIDRIVDSDSSILLIGETGVGKEIFAEYIHQTSSRALRPFVKIALSALPADLLESELFGHERGSFTSASTEKKGLLEIADTGSIFLDDIDDVPLQIQTKLLRVLESRELMRIGGTKPIPIDVRLITASKVDLKELVNRGIFRADLFYRINVMPFDIPPLRERRDDIPPLVEYFLKHYKPEKELKVSPSALKAMVNYSWPGNVRELKNVIQRVSLFEEEEVQLTDLPPEIRNENPVEFLLKACNKCYIDGEMDFDQIVKCLEHNLLKEALKKSLGNQSQAAKSLGLSLSTFRDKLKKHQHA
jgi:transcriptional regulator with PAS, ATPase and Fis domain